MKFILLLLLTITALADAPARIEWGYPSNEVAQVVFRVYSTKDPTRALNQWQLLDTVTGRTNTTISVAPGKLSYVITASNIMGVALSPITTTNGPPRSFRLQIQ
jgi:hypothetical protein